MVSGFCILLTIFNFITNLLDQTDSNVAISRTAFCKMMENIRSAHSMSMDESFVTAEEEPLHDTTENFIKSPALERCIVQLSEAYVHTDTEEGIIFYERRLISNTNNRNK